MTSLLYVYGVGGLVFLLGLGVGWRHGYLSLSGAGLRRLTVCLFVAGFFLGIQAWLELAPMTPQRPQQPYTGEADAMFVKDGVIGAAPIDYAIVIGYFAVILTIGTWFSRRQRTTRDFFFGGQRFSWWLIAVSLVATTVGSYSFVKYSETGFLFGFSSSQTYLNDWIWFPLLVFGWLPILYFSRVTSIPEYFGRRFDSTVRFWATVCVLIYLIGYIGVNLFTMGKVLNAMVGWDIWTAATVVAVVSAIYVTAGGQTSVIMTDLFQGMMLLLAGVLILVLGMQHMGGAAEMWANLPREHRAAFPGFNDSGKFSTVGIFWQDGLANTAMFYFLNQGIIMRFLSAKSLAESRRATAATILVLMTVAAFIVGGGGWLARALVNAGDLPADLKAGEAFYIATKVISTPGVFGLILAALTAALMSTVDTLITAVAAIGVNDVYKPYIRPDADDKQMLRVARISSVAVTLMGVLLVPIMMNFDTIYEAHGAFTAAVTPPLVVALLFAVFWPRFTPAAALATIVGGLIAMTASIFYPEIVKPFAHGVPELKPFAPTGEGFAAVAYERFLWGMQQYKFMRACFGLGVCTVIALVVTCFTTPMPHDRRRGLVIGTIGEALRHYKGSPGVEANHATSLAAPARLDAEPVAVGAAQLPAVDLNAALARRLNASPGDLLYLTDTRRWLGGLRSTHAVVRHVIDDNSADPQARIGPSTWSLIVTSRRGNQPIRVERLY